MKRRITRNSPDDEQYKWFVITKGKRWGLLNTQTGYKVDIQISKTKKGYILHIEGEKDGPYDTLESAKMWGENAIS